MTIKTKTFMLLATLGTAFGGLVTDMTESNSTANHTLDDFDNNPFTVNAKDRFQLVYGSFAEDSMNINMENAGESSFYVDMASANKPFDITVTVESSTGLESQTFQFDKINPNADNVMLYLPFADFTTTDWSRVHGLSFTFTNDSPTRYVINEIGYQSNPVPEPATLAMLLAGTFFASLAKKKKQ
ncbi:MAG: PEP-CTERM sorting domain-containing protein [Planctomycetota bacterium]|jgi:hypothetical protein